MTINITFEQSNTDRSDRITINDRYCVNWHKSWFEAFSTDTYKTKYQAYMIRDALDKVNQDHYYAFTDFIRNYTYTE